MLRFAVFDPGSLDPSQDGSAQVPPAGFALRHAHLFGADDIPIAGSPKLENGLILCERRTSESCGLSLQYHVPSPASSLLPSIGLVTLQTCLLPERERPYLLTLELARHRLMFILNKLEDWAKFDLPANDPGMVLFESAREAFTRAIVAQGITPPDGLWFTIEAERLARESLALAMAASEQITITQAATQYARRISGELAQAAASIVAPSNSLTDHEAAVSRNLLLGTNGVILPSPPQIGCIVEPEQFSLALQTAVQGCCDFLTMPMRWIEMEPSEGKYLFSKTDRWIEWAIRTARLPVVGGPLIDLRRGAVPDWLYIFEQDYETLRGMVYEHIKTLVTRYRRTVGTWTVVSGLHVASNFALSIEQTIDLTRLAVMVVRKLQPNAKIQVQIDQPWGEYFARTQGRALPPLIYAQMLTQAGVNPDLYALRIEMGQPESGRATRDLMCFSALLDRYANLDKPLSIAALSCPSRAPSGDDLGISGELEPGYWHAPWSESAQAQWMQHIIAIAASKPFVHSIAWQALYDQPGTHSIHDGLHCADLKPKPAFSTLTNLRAGIKAKQPLLDQLVNPSAQTMLNHIHNEHIAAEPVRTR